IVIQTAILLTYLSILSPYIVTALSIFFPDIATTEIFSLSLHDALPICHPRQCLATRRSLNDPNLPGKWEFPGGKIEHGETAEQRSEEHTSELQSRENLVCRLLLEKKNKSE